LFASLHTGILCPTGWHVPSDAEWTTLTDFLNGESVAGGKLKEKGFAHWTSPNEGANNESGFSAIPSGMRTENGDSFDINNRAGYWSSTPNDITGAWSRYLFYNTDELYTGNASWKVYGLSVRCLKN